MRTARVYCYFSAEIRKNVGLRVLPPSLQGVGRLCQGILPKSRKAQRVLHVLVVFHAQITHYSGYFPLFPQTFVALCERLIVQSLIVQKHASLAQVSKGHQVTGIGTLHLHNKVRLALRLN